MTRPSSRHRPNTSSAEASASRAGMKRLVEEFTRFADRHGIPAGAKHDMYVALDEIISNAVKHRRDTRHGRIALDLALVDGMLEATVRDNGAAFDPLTAPRPRTDQPLVDRPIGGLGILLVTELMDAVTYERRGDRNCLVLRRKID